VAGEIATNQQRAVKRVRDMKKALDRAERALKEGKFRTALVELESLDEPMRGAKALSQRALDGLIDVQRPTRY
jgi:hypothetical protein